MVGPYDPEGMGGLGTTYWCPTLRSYCTYDLHVKTSPSRLGDRYVVHGRGSSWPPPKERKILNTDVIVLFPLCVQFDRTGHTRTLVGAILSRSRSPGPSFPAQIGRHLRSLVLQRYKCGCLDLSRCSENMLLVSTYLPRRLRGFSHVSHFAILPRGGTWPQYDMPGGV